MFYSAAKLFWIFADPLNMTLIVLMLAVIMMWTPWRRLGVWLASLLAAGLLAMAVLPLGIWALAPLSENFPSHAVAQDPVDGIVLLSGAAVDLNISAKMGHPIPGKAAGRLVEFMRLARAYPAARLLICGGNAGPGDGPVREGPAIAEYLVSRGLPRDRMMVEDQSRDTYENAVLGKALARPAPDQRWLLVTSAWHMPRAMATFQSQGWSIKAAPPKSESRTFRPRFNLRRGLNNFKVALHEYIGLVAYRLNGRTKTLWPAQN